MHYITLQNNIMGIMKISVIIPTRNRAQYLSKTLQSLLKNTPLSSAEIIIIDNGSTDNTEEIALNFIKNDSFDCRYIYEPTPGLHVARNLGAQLARGKILSYLDDDIFVGQHWLQSIVESFQKYPDLALLGGPCIPFWEAPPPDWILSMKTPTPKRGWVLDQLSLIDLERDTISPCSPWHVFGCNFSVRKTILFDANGFHPDGMPAHLIRYRGDGESHLSKYIEKNNLLTLYHPHCYIEHRVPQSRLSSSYIKSVEIRNVYSQCFTECRASAFSFPEHAKLILTHFKKSIKSLWLFLMKRHSYINVTKAWLAFWICLRNSFSPQMRSWICQRSYFKKDYCPYKK